MKIFPSAPLDLSKFAQPKSELEVFYGLPHDVKFCKICNMSNQQPMSSNEYAHSHSSTKTTLSFDERGVCHACNSNKLKEAGEIDWDEREREMIELCNQYRKNDGSYDCIVGGSGGKDSAMQSHLLKYKYGMNPLTVTSYMAVPADPAHRICRHDDTVVAAVIGCNNVWGAQFHPEKSGEIGLSILSSFVAIK